MPDNNVVTGLLRHAKLFVEVYQLADHHFCSRWLSIFTAKRHLMQIARFPVQMCHFAQLSVIQTILTADFCHLRLAKD